MLPGDDIDNKAPAIMPCIDIEGCSDKIEAVGGKLWRASNALKLSKVSKLTM